MIIKNNFNFYVKSSQNYDRKNINEKAELQIIIAYTKIIHSHFI